MESKLFAETVVDNIEYFRDKKILDNSRRMIVDCLEKAKINKDTELSKRQFNEILLLCNERTVTDEFFQYFTNNLNKLPLSKFSSLIDRFKKHSMLRFGNFRFAFRKMTSSVNMNQDLGIWSRDPNRIIDEFKKRPKPILEIAEIGRDKIHKLGYLSEDQKGQEIRKTGEYNTNTYLTSDYMDVYVATSMRDETDYQSVFDLCQKVFSNEKIKELNIRYFDPTQSYHKDRIAKGLIEGLMLKRAKCTIYAAQESDSLGKDSELASTLAQGKPVIAFVPEVNDTDPDYIKNLGKLSLNKLCDKGEIYREQVLDNEWTDFNRIMTTISNYLSNQTEEDVIRKNLGNDFAKLIKIICNAEKSFYDHRARILQRYHPLGLQIHLETGVANGVLVARTPEQCSDLLFDVLTNQLDFDIKRPGESIVCNDKALEDNLNYRLVEKKTKSVFRVVTTDDLITTSFWNFYLKENQ